MVLQVQRSSITTKENIENMIFNCDHNLGLMPESI